MISDTLGLFAGDQTALDTGGAESSVFGNVIDTGGDGINDVDDVYLVIEIQTSVTSAGAATVEFDLVSADSADLATNPVVMITGPAVAKATLVAGYRYCAIELPKGKYSRYLGVKQTIGTAALTAGKATAFLTKEPSTWVPFKAGI